MHEWYDIVWGVYKLSVLMDTKFLACKYYYSFRLINMLCSRFYELCRRQLSTAYREHCGHIVNSLKA